MIRWLSSPLRSGPGLFVQFARCERGSVLVLSAFGFVAMLAVIGLSIDVGRVLNERREMQNAADAAALAGVGILMDGGSNTTARNAATDWASRNAAGVSTTVNLPPAGGTHAGDPDCVQVRAQETVSDFFVPGLGAKTVAAEATACLEEELIAAGVISLNPHACSATNLNGNIRLTVNGGATITNSDCAANALNANGNVTVTTEENLVVGGWRLTGSVSVNPTPHHAHPVDDPLAGLPYPVPPTTVRSCPNLNGSGSYTFQPGVYNCTISPNGNWTLTFEPGNYLVTGGFLFNGNLNVHFGAGIYTVRGSGITVNGNANISGTGVMFFLDGTSTRATWNGNGAINLDAPASGTYRSVLLFQHRGNGNTVTVNGNFAAGNWGTIYAAGAALSYSGNSGSSLQYIVDRYSMNGNAEVTITFANNIMARRKVIRLVD